MGVVVAALHLQLDQKVAIKFLLPEAVANPDVVSRFAREARAAAKIQSEHVARVIDVGTLRDGLALHGDGVPRGRRTSRASLQRARAAARSRTPSTTSSRPARPSPRRTPRASSTATSSPRTSFCAKRATAPAHRQGARLRHLQDATPGTPERPRLTRTSAILGSPLYMSPEQMKAIARASTRGADIWSLGVILFELVTGAPPVRGRDHRRHHRQHHRRSASSAPRGRSRMRPRRSRRSSPAAWRRRRTSASRTSPSWRRRWRCSRRSSATRSSG